MRIVLLLVCQILLLQSLYTQPRIRYDSSDFASRQFSSGQLQKYRSDSDFMYERVLEPPRSIWDRFWDWFWEKAGEIFGTKDGRRMLNTIIILLAIAILVFFILKISGMTNIGLFGKKSSGQGLNHALLDEDIHSINFDQAIHRAIETGNFRLAVRLLYLQSLKNLTDRQLINWQINKTNVAYVHELEGRTLQQPFSRLTAQFETNWYGERHIGAEEFNGVREQFDLFNRQLQTQ